MIAWLVLAVGFLGGVLGVYAWLRSGRVPEPEEEAGGFPFPGWRTRGAPLPYGKWLEETVNMLWERRADAYQPTEEWEWQYAIAAMQDKQLEWCWEGRSVRLPGARQIDPSGY